MQGNYLEKNNIKNQGIKKIEDNKDLEDLMCEDSP